MTSQQVIALINKQSGQITSTIIKDLIKDHESSKLRTLRLYNAYMGDVPIKNRTFKDTTKINNKLLNDYRGDIIDEKVGYIFGIPIKYKLDEEKYEKTKLEVNNEAIRDFLTRNNVDDLDSSTGKIAAICGHAGRLCYIDKEGNERLMNIMPWEVIFVYDATVDEMQYALIYYEVDYVNAEGKSVKRTKVEFYDKKNITFFLSNEKGDFELDITVDRNPMPHMFNYVPVVKYTNNDTQQGDFEKVEENIDAYDRLMSDIQNEVEEFRLAYLAFFGCNIDTETIIAARASGAFQFPENSSAEFLVKDLNGAAPFLENHKKTLNENIYKFSKSVDMRDEQFSGAAMSGESRKWKLFALENDAITKERKFTKANRDMFKVICSGWDVKGIKINPYDIQQTFTRNLPVDLLYLSEVSMKLKGQVSEETRLSLLPFVKDVKLELDLIKQDNDILVDLDTMPPAEPKEE